MKRISLFMSERQVETLNRIKKNTGIPIAELIRRAVEKELKRFKE